MSKKPLKELIDNFTYTQVFHEMMKGMASEAPFDFPVLKRKVGDKEITITGSHVDMEDVYACGSSSCKTCYGKGYYVSNIEKTRYPDPSAFMVLKPNFEEGIPEDLSEEQKKLWKEKRKKEYEDSKFWRIYNICPCAKDRFIRKNPDVAVNQLGSIFVRFDYEYAEGGTA